MLSAALVLSALFSVHPLRDALTMQAAPDMFSLQFSTWYIVFAPWLNMLDTLSFLSLSQHKMVMLGLWLLPVLLYLACQRPVSIKKFIFTVLKSSLVSLVLLLLIYAVAVLMPRPMSALHVAAPEIVVLDFHSHTNYSWDANSMFTAEKNRQWHEHSGFNAAFITDHSSFKGIEEGKKNNPLHAKDGVLLLDGIETAYHDTAHVMALCATRLNAQEEPFNWSPIPLSKEAKASGCEPLLVQATPGPVQDLKLTHAAGQGVLAIEIHDAAPAGLEEIQHRNTLIKEAKKLNISVVYGSDNHGWAFAASGWSVMRLAGWQAMNAAQLQLAVTTKMRERGFAAVQVVERAMLPVAAGWWQQLTMPVRLFWRMLSMISLAERTSWLVWTWLLFGLSRRKKASGAFGV